jgi:hypothetical protein
MIKPRKHMELKTPSPARVAAGRANGLKSRGAKTPEGKAASARNAITHGFSSDAVVLSSEDEDSYNQLRTDYRNHYKPTNPVEEQMIDDIVMAKWRHFRLVNIERTTLEMETQAVAQDVNARFFEPNSHIRVSVAYRSVEEKDRLFSAINRHAARLAREYRQAIRVFREERANPGAPAAPHPGIAIVENKNQQNEGNEPAPESTPKPGPVLIMKSRDDNNEEPEQRSGGIPCDQIRPADES